MWALALLTAAAACLAASMLPRLLAWARARACLASIPGPPAAGVMGHADIMVDPKHHEQLAAWAQLYGGVFKLRMVNKAVRAGGGRGWEGVQGAGTHSRAARRPLGRRPRRRQAGRPWTPWQPRRRRRRRLLGAGLFGGSGLGAGGGGVVGASRPHRAQYGSPARPPLTRAPRSALLCQVVVVTDPHAVARLVEPGREARREVGWALRGGGRAGLLAHTLGPAPSQPSPTKPC